MAAVGDLPGNLSKLLTEVNKIRYPAEFDVLRAREGNTTAFLPLMHYVLLGFSRRVARWLVERGHEVRTRPSGGDLRAPASCACIVRLRTVSECELSCARARLRAPPQLHAKTDARFVEGVFKVRAAPNRPPARPGPLPAGMAPNAPRRAGRR